MHYDALLIVSFGGPESRPEVVPFLENVLRGRNVPRGRMMAVAGTTAYRSRHAARAVRVACAIWTGSALLWWRARLPNLWGPEPGPGATYQ